MTTLEHLEETVYIDYHILRQVAPGRAVVLVSWTKNGIVDTADELTTTLTIKEDSVDMVGTPITFTGTEAYEANYSAEIDLWDPDKPHVIKINIGNDFERTLTLDAEAGSSPTVAPYPFGPSDVAVELSNVDRGLRLKLNVCNPNFRSAVKNVIVEKAAGLDALAVTYQAAVPVPITIPSAYGDYPYAVISGQKDNLLNATTFNGVYTDRSAFVGRIEYLDEYNNYIEEPDTNLIDNYDSNLIVSKGSILDLDPAVDNDYDALYKVGEDTYYRYRPDQMNTPYQAFNNTPSFATKYVELSDIDTNNDGAFDLHIDGTKSPEGTVRIFSGIKNTIGDYTSFSSSVQLSNTLSSYLDPGVSFMDEFSVHDDLDVEEGTIYTYKVTLETWDNKSFAIFLGSKKREMPSKSSVVPTGMNLEDLTIPLVGDNALNENDFQSGVSHTGCTVFFSQEKEDMVALARNLKLEVDCKCRNL